MGFKIAFFVVGCFAALFFVKNLCDSMGFIGDRASKVKGYLCRCEHLKDVYKGGAAGMWHKNWMRGVWAYRVGGKEYKISCGMPGKPDEMPGIVTVICRTAHPEQAYIKGLTLPVQPFAAGAFFVLGLVFILCGLAV